MTIEIAQTNDELKPKIDEMLPKAIGSFHIFFFAEPSPHYKLLQNCPSPVLMGVLLDTVCSLREEERKKQHAEAQLMMSATEH